MSIQGALYELVTGDAAVAALIGDRIYPLTLPQEENGAAQYPAAVQRMIDQGRDYEHCYGEGERYGAAVALRTTVIEVEVYGQSYGSARAAADALDALWDGYHGVAGGEVISLITVRRQEEREVDVGGGGEGLRRVRFWLEIQHKPVS